jgi:hypothetical protein
MGEVIVEFVLSRFKIWFFPLIISYGKICTEQDVVTAGYSNTGIWLFAKKFPHGKHNCNLWF